jgi:hypothetical protein
LCPGEAADKTAEVARKKGDSPPEVAESAIGLRERLAQVVAASCYASVAYLSLAGLLCIRASMNLFEQSQRKVEGRDILCLGGGPVDRSRWLARPDREATLDSQGQQTLDWR